MSLSVVRNVLGEKSIRHLSKAQWPCLEEINLGKLAITVGRNKISSSGWSFICRTNWKQLKEVRLCKIVLNKIGTVAKKTRT